MAILAVLMFSDTSTLLLLPPAEIAQAAEVTIDSTVSTSVNTQTHTGPTSVFISNQVGYKFYRDSDGRCEYAKTSDGGLTWAASVIIDNQTDCQSITVWYDKWTPGDTGDNIHIVTMDNGADDLWYNRLDTSTDTRLLGANPISMVVNSGQTGSLGSGVNKPSVTKGTDGTIYAVMGDGGTNADSYIVECTTSCNLTTGWTETGTNPLDLQPDWSLLLPLSGGDIMLITRDRSANDIEYKTWNNTSWSASWTTIDGNARENNTWDVGMAAVANPSTGKIFLAYAADNDTLGTNDDIRTASYSGGSWTAGPDIITDDARGIQQVAMAIDANNDDVYVGYSLETTAGDVNSSNVYWATSSAAYTSWSAEQGPVNASSDNIYGVDLNYYSDERIFMSWYEAGPDDMFGDTIADIAPATIVTALGTQAAIERASTSDLYIGGTFVFTENIVSRNVTDITVSEAGSIDGSTEIGNIELYYDLDTSAPYDCVSESYSGTESQYGSTDANGFNGPDGLASFADSVTITPTQSMCVYTVLDILKDATDSTTIDIEISNPSTDVIISGGAEAVPVTPVAIDGDTDVVDADITQIHFHWRNDDGNESGATSRTGGVEDTDLATLARETPIRLRFAVSNEGSTTSVPTTFQLEYTEATGACAAATGWIDIDATDDAWNLTNSTFITDGADSTNIGVGSGGVTDENSTFLTPNGGLRDTSSVTGSLTLDTNHWTELEYSVVASTTATEGSSYCFRVTDSGETLGVYDVYPKATLAADATATANGSQTASVSVLTTDFHTGGLFSVTENTGSRNVTDVTLTETGTVDGTVGIENVRLQYDLDTSAPYDCASESYAGTELQFGSLLSSFATDNASNTFSGSVAISATQAVCFYPVLDITSAANNADTIDFIINSGSEDIVVSGGGSVSPGTTLDITGSTAITGPIVTQTHYHFRNDDGNESAATSATGGSEDTALSDFTLSTPTRVRIGLSNEGPAAAQPVRYQLEYGIKLTTCDAVALWTDVNAAVDDAWDMYDSTFLTNGETTTNIAEATGGVTDENTTFLGSNEGVLDTESLSGTTTLSSTNYLDLEYSITSTKDTSYGTEFCFRVTENGTPLIAYDTYPEIAVEQRRDFFIQRGTTVVTGTSTEIVAGTDYQAPKFATTSFIRITNAHHTGAGRDGSIAGTPIGAQNSDDYGVYILNGGNITESVRFARDTDSINNSYVAWEIVEYIGAEGSDNEMVVRDEGFVSLSAANTVATGSVLSNVSDDSDVVVFITGQHHVGGNRTEAYSHQHTSSWSSTSSAPVFERGATGNNGSKVSYVVVEFSGTNWKVQRAEHAYVATDTAETEDITAINSLARTFLHTQKRHGVTSGLDDFGHHVYLSSMGAVTFYVPATANLAVNPVSVAWVIENTQTSTGAMEVQRNTGFTAGGAEPVSLTVSMPVGIEALNNSSIFSMTYHTQIGNGMPRAVAAFRITSLSEYEVWRSDANGTLYYRTEIVEWPVADLSLRQNYYRIYTDNDALTPTDPWPAGVVDLGENTSITAIDEPLADGQRARIRMSIRVNNATLPAGLKSFHLQYAQRETTCSAAASWQNVGDFASSTVWRGHSTAVTDGTSLSGNPPTGGDLLLSVSDVAGRFSEDGPSAANEYSVADTEDVEYDWVIAHNGALQRSTYCFRMVESDGAELSEYLEYPQIRTEGYTPVTQNWQWFDDETNETPTVPLAATNTTPGNLDKGNLVKLRVTVAEIKNLPQNDARFKLQFSESADFSSVTDVVASGACVDSSGWCYADGAGNDNATITTSVLLDNDGCVASTGGCGVHNETSDFIGGFTHAASVSIEEEFTLQYTNVERDFGKVYYFRLYDVTNDEPVLANTGETYPSVAGEAAGLTFTIDGIASAVSTEGVTTDVTTTATSIPFGSLPLDTEHEAAQRITVDTNATEGYQILKYVRQNLINDYGSIIPVVTGTNSAPSGWGTGCAGSAIGCFGYHAGDDILQGGSTRFSPDDSYAAATTTPQEVMYSSVPATESSDIVYKIQVGAQQPAGEYKTDIVYIAIPVY